MSSRYREIAVVGPVYPFRGGIAHFGGCLFNELQIQGISANLINLKSQYPSLIFPGSSQFEKGGEFSQLPSVRVLTPYNPLSYNKTLKAILKVRPDLVIFNYFIPFLAPAYTYLLKKLNRLNIPTLIITHNIIAHERWPLAAYLTNRMLNSAAKIMTLSDAVYDEAVKIVPVDRVIKGFHPLYSFLDKKRYTPAEAKKLLGLNGKPVILFFGYIKPYKGVEMLIRSFSYVKEKYPQAELMIVGEIYKDKKLYSDLINASEHGKAIMLKDRYVDNDEVEMYFKSADLLALPYLSATQSGVIQIAYSMGIGAVVTPVGGLPEKVIQGKTGTISKGTDPASYAAAIIDYLSLDKEYLNEQIASYRDMMSWAKLVTIIKETEF